MEKITFTLDGFKPFTFDPEKHYLGVLCYRGHAVPGTSLSPRRIGQGMCLLCERLLSHPKLRIERREKKRERANFLAEQTRLLNGQTVHLNGFKPLIFNTEKHFLSDPCDREHEIPGLGIGIQRKHKGCVFCCVINAKRNSEKRYPQIKEERKRKAEEREKAKLTRKQQIQVLAETLHDQTVVLPGFTPFTFDVSKHRLGTLCKRGHEFLDTGMSVTNLYKVCIFCARLRGKEFALAKYHQLKHDPEYIEGSQSYRRVIYHKTKHRPEFKAKRKAYAQSDRGKLVKKASETKRRALKQQNHAATFSTLELEARFLEFDNRCAYCGSAEKLSLDHFIAISVGGAHCLGNLVPACLSCNSSKQEFDPLGWYSKQDFFDRQRWKKILRVLGKTEATYNQIPLL